MTSPFTCLDGSNMAAVALKTQQTALEAEAALYEADLAFAAALNRRTFTVDLTTTITGISPNTQYDLFSSGGGTYVERFNNTGVPVKESGLIRVPAEGLWQVGLNMNMTADGLVDDNTYRDFRLAHCRQTSASPLGYNVIWYETSTLMESNTGVGTDGTVIADFYMLARDIIKVFLQHGNTSSNMRIPNSPNSRFWGTLLSTSDQVRVV